MEKVAKTKFAIVIPNAQFEALKEQAASKGISVNTWCAMLLTEWAGVKE